MVQTFNHFPEPVRRASAPPLPLKRSVLLALGLSSQERENLVIWFSDLVDHPCLPVLVLGDNKTGLPEATDLLGLVASVRLCPLAGVASWLERADIITLGSLGWPSDLRGPVLSLTEAGIVGVTRFPTRHAAEWQGAVRALLDDPALCADMKEAPLL